MGEAKRDIITSSQNSIVKEIAALKSKKHREEKGCFVIEGARFFEEALKERANILKVVVSEGFLAGRDARINEIRLRIGKMDTITVADRIFKNLSDTETPQGILAVVKMEKTGLENLPHGDNRLVILERLQDPGNMGTIIRTADAMGFNGVVISHGCVDPYNPKVLRSTMGSVFRVPLYFYTDTEEAFSIIKNRGVRIYATSPRGTTNCHDAELGNNIAFIIGNEASGIAEETASLADEILTIPMPGRAESLNASVAAAVLMYESLRQRLAV